MNWIGAEDKKYLLMNYGIWVHKIVVFEYIKNALNVPFSFWRSSRSRVQI
jgi:hypothetical protein